MIDLLAEYNYRPFLTPLPVWDYWVLLLIPLCAGIAIVYKTIKCRYVSQVPKEALILTLFILAAMVGVGAGVLLSYKIFVEWT
ncbi:MAG: hypothetical protein H7144_16305 [Burkholderiales bacterium]|nr:hypothetical protein [Phycisphaerae bacterium]